MILRIFFFPFFFFLFYYLQIHYNLIEVISLVEFQTHALSNFLPRFPKM